MEEFKYFKVVFSNKRKMEQQINRKIGVALAVMTLHHFILGRLSEHSHLGADPGNAWYPVEELVEVARERSVLISLYRLLSRDLDPDRQTKMKQNKTNNEWFFGGFFSSQIKQNL